MRALDVSPPRLAVLALGVGLTSANFFRPGFPAAVACVVAATIAALDPTRRAAAIGIAAALGAWWWGGVRLDRLDGSVLASRVGTADTARLVITSPLRVTRFETRAQATIERFGRRRLHEAVAVRLARAPPHARQGAIVEGVAIVTQAKRTAGFDERTWLRRHGIHTVIRLDAARVVAFRGGMSGLVDRVRLWLARSVARGVHGERAALLDGIVLGDDGGIDETLRRRFRASGLYHVLAVSGQNVALVAGGALATVWLLGAPRLVGHLCALAAIALYALAVGAQPSVVRAAIAGSLTSVAWLSGRLADRWHFLLLGAVGLLAWNPYTVFDAGFQLSFAAVLGIFLLARRIRDFVEGYPLPHVIAEAVSISAACGIATAPVMWFQFHALSLVAVPANALVAPTMLPLLTLAFAGAGLSLAAPQVGAAAAWLNGWLAAYIACCARAAGGLPGAQITSTRGLLVVLAGGFLVAAYACDRWPPARSSPFT